jgi:hypothetical protein
MKHSAYIFLTVGVLLVTILTTHGTSQNIENPGRVGKYSTLIDETIAKCRTKAALLNSDSPNIRHQAAREYLKGAYLKVHKKELVAYLISVNSEPSSDRVEYHLNKRFYQSLKPDQLYVYIEASQMLAGSD